MQTLSLSVYRNVHSILPGSSTAATTRPSLTVYFWNSIVEMWAATEVALHNMLGIRTHTHWSDVIPPLRKATAYFAFLFNYKRIYCVEETNCWLYSYFLLIVSAVPLLSADFSAEDSRWWITTVCSFDGITMKTFYARKTQNIFHKNETQKTTTRFDCLRVCLHLVLSYKLAFQYRHS